MKVVISILLILVGLVGLGMSLCGGTVTLMMLAEPGGGPFFLFPVGCVVVGVALIIGAVRMRRRLGKRQRAQDAENTGRPS